MEKTITITVAHFQRELTIAYHSGFLAAIDILRRTAAHAEESDESLRDLIRERKKKI